MLIVYSAKWCPHCIETEAFLEKRKIPFQVVDIEKAPEKIVKKVIEVNGGEDWVIPTLEYNGKWRPGKIFNEDEIIQDLTKIGVIGE